MSKMLAAALSFARGEEGVAIVEYALALVLIAVVSVVAIAALGAKLSAFFDVAATSV